jgi:hypothetical protein
VLQNTGVRVRENRVQNLTVRFLEENGYSRLAYTFWDNYLLLGSPQGFEEVAQRLGQRRGLRNEPGVDSLVAPLPSLSTGATLTNIAGARNSSLLYFVSTEVWEADGLVIHAAVSRKELLATILENVP